jgi:crotonobetainyl-CoA:carnitine CoA-transferase CaiB-like acyl-CoA transferase
MGVESELVDRFWAAVTDRPHPALEFAGDGTLASRYAVSEFAAAAIATAGLAAGDTVVSRPLADAWFGQALRPVGWQLPSPWDPLAGDYRTADGWIRLHTNAPHHRLAALLVLGVAERSVPRIGAAIVGQLPEPEPDFAAARAEEKGDVTAAVAQWRGTDLETEIVEAGGAAAVLRSPADWAAHPQGQAVAAEPLIAWTAAGSADREAGFRVLDLTRVIAGPVATRFLAGLGADVLRIDPPDWDEPAIVPEMTLGKRAARANFLDAGGMRKLGLLIAEADVIVHGYRADALERLGLGDDEIRAINPGIVDVAINAYGWSGPWRNRRGFDSLVQMSSGIAFADPPTPLPVQALDHATGYLAAAAALEGLRRRRETGRGSTAKLSLARTALELPTGSGAAAAGAPNLPTSTIETPWGSAALLDSPLTVDGEPLRWTRMPRALGTDTPRWA